MTSPLTSFHSLHSGSNDQLDDSNIEFLPDLTLRSPLSHGPPPNRISLPSSPISASRLNSPSLASTPMSLAMSMPTTPNASSSSSSSSSSDANSLPATPVMSNRLIQQQRALVEHAALTSFHTPSTSAADDTSSSSRVTLPLPLLFAHPAMMSAPLASSASTSSLSMLGEAAVQEISHMHSINSLPSTPSCFASPKLPLPSFLQSSSSSSSSSSPALPSESEHDEDEVKFNRNRKRQRLKEAHTLKQSRASTAKRLKPSADVDDGDNDEDDHDERQHAVSPVHERVTSNLDFSRKSAMTAQASVVSDCMITLLFHPNKLMNVVVAAAEQQMQPKDIRATAIRTIPDMQEDEMPDVTRTQVESLRMLNKKTLTSVVLPPLSSSSASSSTAYSPIKHPLAATDEASTYSNEPYSIRVIERVYSDGTQRRYVHAADLGGVIERKSNISRMFQKFTKGIHKVIRHQIMFNITLAFR